MTSERGTGRASSRYKRMQINSDGEFRFSCHDGSRRSVMCGDPVSPAADSCRRYPPPRRVSESFGLCVFFPLPFVALSAFMASPPLLVSPLPLSIPSLLSWPFFLCFFSPVRRPLCFLGPSISAPPFPPYPSPDPRHNAPLWPRGTRGNVSRMPREATGVTAVPQPGPPSGPEMLGQIVSLFSDGAEPSSNKRPGCLQADRASHTKVHGAAVGGWASGTTAKWGRAAKGGVAMP